MSKLIKKVSNLFIDEVGRVNFVVGALIDGRPIYFLYRTRTCRKGLEIYVEHSQAFKCIFNEMFFEFSDVSLRSIRKGIYDNYDKFAFIFPTLLEV